MFPLFRAIVKLQWSCSFRPLSDDTLASACNLVANWLHSNLPKLKAVTSHDNEAITKAPALLQDHYDVFISYSHKNSDVAHEIKRHLTVFHPDWKIFIDVADLKTGVVWQTKLYTSIGKIRIGHCSVFTHPEHLLTSLIPILTFQGSPGVSNFELSLIVELFWNTSIFLFYDL